MHIILNEKSFKNEKKEKYTASFLDLFDTASTVIAYDTGQESFDNHYQQFYNELETYDHLYDIYHLYEGINNLYIVNANAAKAPVIGFDTAIESIQAMPENRNAVCYDLQGRRLSQSPRHGICLRRQSDGRIVKVCSRP